MVRIWLNRLTACLSDRMARRIGVWLGLVFALLYLYSVGNIVISPGADLAFGKPTPSIFLVSDWSAKIWKSIAPFAWEPIAPVYPLHSVALFISARL